MEKHYSSESPNATQDTNNTPDTQTLLHSQGQINHTYIPIQLRTNSRHRLSFQTMLYLHTQSNTHNQQLISWAAQQVLGCRSINIDSHFNSSYSFIYLLIHLFISSMPKKFQLLWLKSDNRLTWTGFSFLFIFNLLDTKMYSTSWSRSHFLLHQSKEKCLHLLLYNVLRYWYLSVWEMPG